MFNLLLSFLIGITVFYIIHKRRAVSQNLPPRAEKGLPILGFLREYRKDQRKAFAWAREQYGEVFMFNMLLFDAVVVCNSELYRPIYNEAEKEGSHFSFEGVAEIVKGVSRGVNPYDKYPNFQLAVDVVRLGLANSSFGEFSQMIQYRIKQLIEKQIEENPNVDCVEFADFIVSYAELECIFGHPLWENYPDEAETLVKSIIDLEHTSVRPDVLFLPNWRTPGFKKCLDLREKIDPLLEKARNLTSEKPVFWKEWLKHYLELRMQSNCPAVSDENINELSNDLLSLIAVAARTNSVHLFIWTLVNCISRPKYWDKLLEEQKLLRERTGESELFPTWEQIEKLPFLECCLKESMRLHGVMSGTRKIISDVQIGDFRIPSGKFVMMVQGLSQIDPNLFPEPFEYKPERFMAKQDYGMKYLPFGAGRHICTGRFFAMMVLKSSFVSLLQNFNIQLKNPSQSIPDPDFTKGVGSSVPATPVWVRISKRL